jgi:hypothetical protein
MRPRLRRLLPHLYALSITLTLMAFHAKTLIDSSPYSG